MTGYKAAPIFHTGNFVGETGPRNASLSKPGNRRSGSKTASPTLSVLCRPGPASKLKCISSVHGGQNPNHEKHKSTPLPQSKVHVVYKDHVFFTRSDPILLKPALREALGWLIYDCQDYIIICWDRDADPPTIKNGDPKASGLVLLRTDILELRRIA